MNARKLTAKQTAFAHEYTIDGNATQAAIRAGYSPRTANPAASRLLANVKVAELIAELNAARFARVDVTADRVLEEIARVAFANMGHYATWGPDGIDLVDSKTLPLEALAVVAEVGQTKTQHGGTMRIKLHDKVGALRDLAKLAGLEVDSPHERAAKILAAMDDLERATTTEAAA